MEILIIGLIAGIGVWLAKKQTDALPATQTQATSQLPTPIAPDTASQVESGIAKVPVIGTAVAVTVAGVVLGASLGKKLDQAVSGGDTSALTQTGGAIGGAVVVGGAVAVAGGTVISLALGGTALAAAFGPIGLAVYAVIAALAIVTYAVILFINDLEELSYGQGGAIRDYEKHWNEVYSKCHDHLKAVPQFATYKDSEIAMVLTPFVDGFMQEQNKLIFNGWWRTPKGVTEVGLDTVGHLKHGRDRGKFVGDVGGNSADTASLIWTRGNHWDRYKQSDWIVNNMPPGTYKKTTYPAIDAKNDITTPGRVGSRFVVVPAIPSKVAYSLNPDTLATLQKSYEQGRQYCNVTRYHNYMSKNPDKISDPNTRFAQGIRAGAFEGSSGASPGGLKWAGQEFNYSALDALT